MARKQTIAEVAKEMLESKSDYWTKTDYVTEGSLNLSQGIFEECFERGLVKRVYNDHPLNKIAVVLSALDRNSKSKHPLFEKAYIRYVNANGRAEVLHRSYRLIDSSPGRSGRLESTTLR